MTSEQAFRILSIYARIEDKYSVERQEIFDAHLWLPEEAQNKEYPLSYVRKVIAIRKYCVENVDELLKLSNQYWEEEYNKIMPGWQEKKEKWYEEK